MPARIPPDSRAPTARWLWIIPFAALALMLWSEAAVPGLPHMQQGPELWRALGDSTKGQGFEGLLSWRAVKDTGLRLILTAVCFGLAWMAVRFSPARLRVFGAAAGRAVDALPKRRFGLALFTAGVALPLSWFGFIRGLTPRLGDEIAYLFQSRLFAGRLLTMHAPVRPRFFYVHLIVRGGRWYSQYPPGHPLVQSLGWLIGAPWLVGPVAGGIALLAIWRITARLYDERTGRIAGLLMLSAPFFIYQSGSYLSHSTCLMLGSLSALGLLTVMQSPPSQKLRRGGLSWKLAMLAGVSGSCLGLAAAARPLTGIGLTPGLGLIGVFGLWAWLRTARAVENAGPPSQAGAAAKAAVSGLPRPVLARGLLVFALFGAGAAGAAGIAPVYNVFTTGKPLLWGYELAQKSPHALGFGTRGDMHIDFTPQRALFNTRLRWRWLDGGTFSGDDPIPGSGFFFWPFPFLILPLALLVPGRGRLADLALAAVPLSLAAAYFPYYYLDMCWGPRFLYEASFAFVPLAARGAVAWATLIPSLPAPGGRRVTGGAIVSALLVLSIGCGLGHALIVGEKLYDPVTWPTRRVDRALEKAVRKAGVGHDVVFMKNAGAWYETAWRRMFVDRDLSIMFVKDLGKDNAGLLDSVDRKNAWVAAFNGDPKYPAFRVTRWTPPTDEADIEPRIPASEPPTEAKPKGTESAEDLPR